MAYYRAYFIGQDRHFVKATDVDVADDDSAILAVRSLLGAHDIEIWERDRKVAKLDGLKNGLTPVAAAGGIAT
ncbi:MAG: hypothetical protein ABWY82_28740 [Tardiphaga sp.]